MKMGKKVREYKAGDFIFAKVKGYPAWPARVQRMNGKKYFVYFYGTAETANLPPNMIFDYAENKDKFLTKTVKRRDFNDGVKQIEYDFANNVPLEQVIGVAPEAEVPEGANDTANESAANETMDDSMADTTAADETMADETTQNDTGIEDSDETGALVIDEGKQAKTARKSTPKTPAKETPKAKEPKTPRGRTKKDEESKEEVKEDDKKEEELVSRSGRKIRPKRYLDEHTEENTTLPSPAPKKRRGASPVDKDKEKEKEKDKESKEKDDKEKNIKHFNAVTQAELEDLKEPFTPEDPEKENIIIAYLPSGQYIGIKLFQSRPSSFKNESARLQWDKQAARNALTLKSQLEKGHITPQSVIGQLVMDLNLTDEEKATLDKDRETEEKKSRVQYLKVEMKLMELDTKIKTCLCLEKADTELCLKILDELKELDIKPLMLLKHPTTVETIKRMRAYVGNTPSWELSESEALQFSQQAHKIRKQADNVYNSLKKLFPTPEGLSFWEFFMERVDLFKKATEKLTTEEILEIVHEPLEMSTPTAHTMKSSVEAANEEEKEEKDMAEEAEKEKLKPDEPEEEAKKTKSTGTSAKTKKAVNSTPAKTPGKRQSSRNKPEEKEKDKEEAPTPATEDKTETNTDTNTEQKQEEQNKDKDAKEPKENDAEQKDKAKEKKEKNSKESKSNKDDDVIKDNNNKEKDKVTRDKNSKDKEKKDKKDTEVKESDVKEKTPEKPEEAIDDSKKESSSEEEKESTKESSMEVDKEKSTEKSDKEDNKDEKDKTEDEPRAKRSRDSKKTDPPPRSPTKRKSKF